jgi:hypothetical protein
VQLSNKVLKGLDLAKSILRMEGSKCGPHHLGLEIDSL